MYGWGGEMVNNLPSGAPASRLTDLLHSVYILVYPYIYLSETINIERFRYTGIITGNR